MTETGSNIQAHMLLHRKQENLSGINFSALTIFANQPTVVWIDPSQSGVDAAQEKMQMNCHNLKHSEDL